MGAGDSKSALNDCCGSRKALENGPSGLCPLTLAYSVCESMCMHPVNAFDCLSYLQRRPSCILGNVHYLRWCNGTCCTIAMRVQERRYSVF